MLVPPLDRTLAASGVSRSCKGNARPKLVPVSTLLLGEQFLGHGVMRPWSIHKFLPHLPCQTAPRLTVPYRVMYYRVLPNPTCLAEHYRTAPRPKSTKPALPASPCQAGSHGADPEPDPPDQTCLTLPIPNKTQRNGPYLAQSYLPNLSSPPVPGQTCPN